jgi:hypothetical protein
MAYSLVTSATPERNYQKYFTTIFTNAAGFALNNPSLPLGQQEVV